ncbi:CHAT domain-containing protein [Amycolatopsis sp. NBC_01307]|uniref:CHAT domain-containing protein n=1 Tax=Amycolatopsis sp. NBC_01307 TaxID=2903561 RepID=UPI002E154634|nr:CHAT domain-containing protein [Amycolatopsis sp. NBC_01307]
MPALQQLHEDSALNANVDHEVLEDFKEQLQQASARKKYIPPFYESRTLTSQEELEALLQKYPQASTQEFVTYLEAHKASTADCPDVFIKSIDLMIELFRAVAIGSDVSTAWTEYRTETKNFGSQIRAEQEQIEETLKDLGNERLRPGVPRFETYDRAMLLALITGNQIYLASLHARRGAEILGSSGFIDDESSAAAEEDLSRARELATTPDALAIHAEASLNLGTILSRSSRGNPSENQERAIALLQQCSEYYRQAGEPDKWALCSTNLAIIYNDRLLGDRIENLRKAEELCISALDIRSPAKDVIEWSFTAAELARILARPELGTTQEAHRANLQRSIRQYKEIDNALDEYGNQERRSGILINRASALVDLARLEGSIEQSTRAKVWIEETSGGEVVDADEAVAVEIATLVQRANLALINPKIFGSTEPPEWAMTITRGFPNERQRLILDEVIADVEMALSIGSYAETGGALSAYKILFDVSEIREDPIDDQIAFLKAGLDASRERPVDSLMHEMLVGLGSKHAQIADWNQSAEYFSRAVSAIKYNALRSLDSPAGVVDWSIYPKLVEWCAYALTKAGRLQQAILVLENARARTLASAMARDEADLDYVASVDADLAQRFFGARQRLRTTKVSVLEFISSDSVDILKTFEDIVREIREIPKMKDFMGEVDLMQVFEAARLFGPIAYPVSTPAGTVCLLVSCEGEQSDASVVCVADSTVGSSEIVRCVARFDGESLVGMSSANPAGVDDGIAEATWLLRDAFVDSLARNLILRKHKNIAIVPAGILGMIPYSAVYLSRRKVITRKEYRFSDLFAVTVAPSAAVIRRCYSRAERINGRQVNVVAAADPEREIPGRSLRYAITEVNAIRKYFSLSDDSVLIGQEVTAANFLELASGASHVHFAGHGRSDRIEPLDSAIICSDGPLTAGRIRDSAVLDSRLVVVSTCESGTLSFGQKADLNDAIGLTSEILSAGSACVIASLWEVNDLATCFLMIKFYEELRRLERGTAVVPGAPAEALRRAQVWLQTRTSRQLGDYRLKWLSANRSIRDADSQSKMESRVASSSMQEFALRRPFAHPRFWAPFVAVGV